METLIVNVKDNSNVEQIISAISLLKGINDVSKLVDLEDLEGWNETNYLCSIPGMKESIIEGMNASREEFVSIDEAWPEWRDV